MEDKKNKDQQNRGSSSNPQNSFESGKQGGKGSQQATSGSRTETDRSTRKDISNNLKNDAVGKSGSNNPTPQNRTDNEQDAARGRGNQ